MIAIDVRDLRKIYRIYKAPVDRLKEIVLRRPFHAEFVALDTMSFSISQGTTFGIIGENGAGKSTLMKLLARTLKPTSGNVAMVGRVAALLELGAGFNPELTGDENIYLNAYLMGLTKDEIDERKQRIIDFSELGDSISRPVKTYSSGMYVRLAFSIATSVNPDILIIDEALSVGDQHFQKKCIDRMTQFKNDGKTIVFCSHSLYHIQELCKTTLWIDHGSMR
ncbi:MAG: ABC transporter ATP-binding protein, partial [Thermodesulfovibrionales bacterium]